MVFNFFSWVSSIFLTRESNPAPTTFTFDFISPWIFDSSEELLLLFLGFGESYYRDSVKAFGDFNFTSIDKL